ncbi:MAG: cell filamentation protein Fic [Comamonadaceae bacterium CG12_big_fil_rev_8_21_14_0_65_59_15]|nr:MAG: cell filamentation protein Fic [Comamonadaceae bacterium CG12_big_fil_rev_8_21_14_0_65_59_15]
MIGYEFLLSKISIPMMPLQQPARIKPVTRVESMPDLLAIPRQVAPDDDSLLSHVLFALRYESIQIPILEQALRLVSAAALLAGLARQPKGGYLRRAAYFWEKANHQALPLSQETTGGNYLEIFDPAVYYTGQNWERSQKYRVVFNGIGPYDYCPIVKRDKKLEQAGSQTLERFRQWAEDPQNAQLLDRVMSWAYLSETRDSYAIENEVPAPDKERAFLQAMAHLRDKRPLTEDYLTELQNLVISNPMKAEVQFRTSQNWLQRGGRGATGIRYVPPEPDSMVRLMDGFMRMANAQDEVPPFIKAALVSFGFVFIHPFMDGNGRISRLLAHYTLNLKGVLPDVNGSPAILPLSVAMKNNERDYLNTLETFSLPARKLWNVVHISDSDFLFDFKSTPLIYAHWSGQQAAKYVTACADAALAQTLIDEALYLHGYDRAFAQIDKNYDLPDKTINLLIQWIHSNHGQLPERRKNAKELVLLQPGQIDGIEAIVVTAFGMKEGKTG